jgi:hypothetical protein
MAIPNPAIKAFAGAYTANIHVEGVTLAKSILSPCFHGTGTAARDTIKWTPVVLPMWCLMEPHHTRHTIFVQCFILLKPTTKFPRAGSVM